MISYRMVAERELAARLIEEPLYIGGSWRAAGGAPISVIDPTSEDRLAEVPSATAADVRAALQSAREAQPAWARTSTIVRGAHLRAIADLLAANRDSLADLLVSEVGKPASQAACELEFTESLVRYNAEWDRRLEGDILPGDVAGEVIHLLRAPVGVVAAICPWNFPLAVLARKLAPALLTGNTVVVKPSEVTPLSTIELFRLIDEQLELPPGVINLLTGGPATGAALVSDELTSMVSFTGHRDTGKAIMAAAAANLTRVALELGGKAPAIVWRDADLDLAIPALVSARHHNSGQVCTCAERVLVHHELLETSPSATWERSRRCASATRRARSTWVRTPWTRCGSARSTSTARWASRCTRTTPAMASRASAARTASGVCFATRRSRPPTTITAMPDAGAARRRSVPQHTRS
jgi:lactaldehyde dehydrogenase/glycolaldehyde dehydrogenase